MALSFLRHLVLSSCTIDNYSFIVPTYYLKKIESLYSMAEDISSVFVPYQNISFAYSYLAHPSPVVETNALAGVSPGKLNYRNSIPDAIFESGKHVLSGVQMDAIILAGQSHHQFLDIKKSIRQGFAIGDGAGLGKGRIIAGIILDNYLQGRKKSIWVSSSSVLFDDATRDLTSLTRRLREDGYEKLRLPHIFEIPHKFVKIDENTGTLFVTYATLSSTRTKANNEDGLYVDRMAQILDWVGSEFDGLIILDEAHKAKGYSSLLDQASSKTGDKVVFLQRKLRNSRIVYVSATIATNIKELEFMLRLGMWGHKLTPFSNANMLFDFVEARGVSGCELVALELKQRGLYLSRHLSYSGCEFTLVKVNSPDNYHELYADCCELWALIIKVTPKRGQLPSLLWANALKFFKALCIGAKLKAAVDITKESLKAGKSVVIGLQSTGEAAYKGFRASPYHAESEVCSPCSWYVESFLKEKLGISEAELGLSICREQPAAKESVKIGSPKRKRRKKTVEKKQETLSDSESEYDTDPEERSDNENEFSSEDEIEKLSIEDEPNLIKEPNEIFADLQESFEVVPVELRNQIVSLFAKVKNRLPLNAIDFLMAEFGYQAVAELTGRVRFQMIHKSQENGKDVYTVKCEVWRKKAMFKAAQYGFQNGDMRIAIISEASSTGISLHSNLADKNTEDRIHIILEAPWTATSICQQIGRTNRTNQKSPPQYKVLMSDIPAEERFASTLACRMASLGALCKGDRLSSYNDIWAEFQTTPKVSHMAIIMLVKTICQNDATTGLNLFKKGGGEQLRLKLFAQLKEIGLVVKSKKGGYLPNSALTSHEKFLNRMLCLPIRIHRILIGFLSTAIDKIKSNITEGIPTIVQELEEHTEGQLLLSLKENFLLQRKVSTTLYTYQKNSICTWDRVEKLENIKYYKKVCKSGLIKVAAAIFGEGNNELGVEVFKPTYIDKMLKSKKTFATTSEYTPCSKNEAKQFWKVEVLYLMSGKCTFEMRNGKCRSGNCKHNKPCCEVGLVVNGLISVWQDIATALGNMKLMKHKEGSLNIIGVFVPSTKIDVVRNVLKARSDLCNAQ